MKKIVFTLLVLSSFFLYDNVFAINESYFENITYDEVANFQDRYNNNYNNSNLSFSKVYSIHSFEGPFYSFSYHKSFGFNYENAEFYKFNLTKELNEMFDTEKLVEYDRSYYFDLVYYTKDKILTNIEDGMLNAPRNYSFITNDFDTLYDNYEVLDNDSKLLSKDFRQTTILNSYITYGRTQCKIADEINGVYKCRVTYQVDPNKFHRSADNPNEEPRPATLVFRFDDKNQTSSSANAFVAIAELGLNSELRGTDDMIPEDEKLPPTVSEEQKSILDYIIELPQTITNAISGLAQILIDGIIDALKFLFIPNDEYLNNWFTSLRDSVESQLGFLNYPIVWILDILNKFLTLEDTGSYLISWPDISVPNFEEHVIIKSGSYDLATLLANPTIKSFHDMYLIIINALILLSFFNLCLNVASRIFGGDVDNYEYLTVDEGYNIDGQTGEVNSLWFRKRTSTRKKVS